MPTMICRQFYIEPRQDKLLKRLAHKVATTEADLISKAIDRYAEATEARQRRREVWDREKAFIEKWRKEVRR